MKINFITIFRRLGMAMLAAAAVLAMFFAGATALEKEFQRQEARTAEMCRHYGDSMDKWARSKNLKSPCEV